MKKVIIIILIEISMIGLLTGCGNKEKIVEGIDAKTITNEDVIQRREVDTFRFENTSLVYMEGTSTLETTVTNASDVDQLLQEFLIVFKDENDDEIITLIGFVGDTIKAGETKVISSSCSEDLTSAKKIEYSVVK